MSSSIGVWRKVVETHSHKTNSREEQERLSEALLHQHRTGKDYYVSEDMEEVSQATMQVWNQVVPSITPPLLSLVKPTPSVSTITPQFIPINSFSSSQSTSLTPTQLTYQPRTGDWSCTKCQNINFAWRIQCKRCGYLK
jgi:hypothetical protein